MAELLIDHGRAVATDLETGEILADQTLDATREYQYRKPANDVNYAPRHHSLAVNLLGGLTLKVTAAKRRRGDLHIGLRRR